MTLTIRDTAWPREIFAILKQVASYRPPLMLLALGIGLAGLIISQVVIDPSPLRIQAFEVGVPLLLLTPILYTAGTIRQSPRAEQRQVWVLLMSLLFAIIASGTVALIVISELAQGGQFRELLFPLIVSSAAGVGVGSLAGRNYHEILTTRQELQTEIRRTRRLNQRLTVINRILRHNVRNRLSVALGLLEQVLDRIDDHELITELRACRQSLTSLHTSAEKALDIEPLWQQESETVTTDLTPVIKRVVRRKREQTPAATIITELPPSVTVRVHPLLPVVIDEAVDNAVRHNDPANVTVEITVTRDADQVVVAIADDGAGIPENELNVLDLDSETPLYHTTGVGLWLIKWVTETSNGHTTFLSNDQGGTTVRMVLPEA